MCRRVNMDARRRMPHTWLLPADSDRATPPVGKIVEPQDLVLVAPVTVPVAAAKLARIVRPDHILFCRGQLSASRAHASGRAGSSRAARSNSSTRVLIWPAWTCASPSATSAAYSLSWATAYVGPGPWGVLGPDLPAHPAQVYEAIGDGLLLVVLLILGRRGPFRDGDGRRFMVALAGWAVIRLVVATWWRDAPVAGPLKAEQLLDLGLLLVAVLVLVALRRRPATIAKTTPSGAPPAVPSGA